MVLSEFWHDRGGRRRINSGDPMAYEDAISGCFLGLVLTSALHSQACPNQVIFYDANGWRETTEDSTEFTPGRCRYD